MTNSRLIGGLLSLLIIIGIISIINRWKSHGVKPVSVDTYGKQYNKIRDQKNIPIIEEDWVAHEYDSSYAFWSNRLNRVNSTKPIHLNKTISFSKGLLLSEEDDFHFEGEGDMAYRLVCRISFKNDADSISFRFIKYFKNAYPPTVGFPVEVQFADSIFMKWGFPNFYRKSVTPD